MGSAGRGRTLVGPDGLCKPKREQDQDHADGLGVLLLIMNWLVDLWAASVLQTQACPNGSAHQPAGCESLSRVCFAGGDSWVTEDHRVVYKLR